MRLVWQRGFEHCARALEQDNTEAMVTRGLSFRLDQRQSSCHKAEASTSRIAKNLNLHIVMILRP